MRVFFTMQLGFLLVLLSHVAVVTGVPGCHGDRDKDHRPRENCTAANFSNIPAGIELMTKVLLFPRNLFTSLSWSSFQIFTEIYEIDLTGNKVPQVTSSDAPMLPSLSVLRLGSNRLRSLSDRAFSACPALTELYLDHNAIDSLSDHTFSGLSKLEILDLSYNQIKVLPKFMLHPLRAIETLYLEINKIKVMPDDWFSQKEEVPYLYLSVNPWACSCSLGYLRRYLDEYEHNVYVRDGPLIRTDAESVVCESPQQHTGKPVLSLEESDLCSDVDVTSAFFQTTNTDSPYKTSPLSATDITPSVVSSDQRPPTSPPPVPDTTVLYHRVVTWSWYQTFTHFIEWSDYSGSRGDGSSLGSHASNNHSTLSTVEPSTESPAITMTKMSTKPATTVPDPSTVTSAPSTVMYLQATSSFATEGTTMSVFSITEVISGQQNSEISPVGVFCFWLFAGCLLLCVASAVCTMATVVKIVVWYRRLYKPLSAKLERRKRGGAGQVRLVHFKRGDENEVAGGEGVTALYRSVLYVHREGGEAVGREGEKVGDGETGRPLVNLESAASAAINEGGEGGVYRKTLYRLLSKEEEIDGWRDVMEECRISAGNEGRRGVGRDEGVSGGGVSRKRYSVILREEREEVGGGREEMDWVVGGWEVKRGGEGAREEEPRSSWGEWLAHYLPSMPWGVTTPPEAEATL